ncbi:MAG: shikimate dehydrogenase family protein, partial [Euzebya sp.]
FLFGFFGEDCGVAAGRGFVLLGFGGSALPAAVALGRLQAAVTVRARDSEAARVVAELARRAGGAPPSGAAARVVINATPLGRHGESLPPELMSQGKGQVALDLNYGDRSPFLVQAARRGAVTVDGLAMLIGQAEAAFARWAGTPPPQGVMSAAVAKSPVRTADAHEDSTSRCTTE